MTAGHSECDWPPDFARLRRATAVLSSALALQGSGATPRQTPRQRCPRHFRRLDALCVARRRRLERSYAHKGTEIGVRVRFLTCRSAPLRATLGILHTYLWTLWRFIPQKSRRRRLTAPRTPFRTERRPRLCL